MNARMIVATAALSIVMVSACNSEDLPGEGDGYVGSIITINRVTPETGAFTSVHVRSATDACGAVYSVNNATVLHRRTTTNSVVTAPPAEFTVGDNVRIWADGPIADSCPGQAHAARIELQP